MNLRVDLTRLQLPPKPSRSFWKLNSSILHHESFIPQFTACFHRLQEETEEFEDEAEWWDNYAKPAIVSFCKSFSASVAKQKNIFKKFLFALLRHATARGNWLLVSQTKEKLNVIIQKETFGLVIRSRDKQNVEEETASIYHLRKVNKQNLNSLRVAQDGRIGYRHNVPMVTTKEAVRIE